MIKSLSVVTQQIGVHEASLCVLLVLEILCSSTKLSFVLMLSTQCAFHAFDFALSVYHLRSHIWGSCVFTLMLGCYGAHGELKTVSNHHTMNTKNSWTHASTNLLGTHWGLEKMANVLHTTFSNAFSRMKMLVCWFKIKWSLYLRIHLRVRVHWIRRWFGVKSVTSRYRKQCCHN